MPNSYARAVSRLRQATADYEAAAQAAIWKSNVEATLGLLAFVVALAAILWRFGAARQQAKVAEAVAAVTVTSSITQLASDGRREIFIRPPPSREAWEYPAAAKLLKMRR